MKIIFKRRGINLQIYRKIVIDFSNKISKSTIFYDFTKREGLRIWTVQSFTIKKLQNSYNHKR